AGAHHAPTPDTVMDDIEINMSNIDVLTQTSMECPMEEGSQANTGSSMVMNDTKMEKTELTEKDPIIQGGTCDMSSKHGNQRDTLSSTSDVTVQSNRHLDLHLSETVMEPTKSDITEWLQSEGFTPVV
ncbi:41059_t:CDS:2, partial [Gigaspora margarita]